MVKKSNESKVLGEVQHLKIKQVYTHKGLGKLRQIASSYIGIFKGKKLVEKDFKTKDEAVVRANEILNNLKKK